MREIVYFFFVAELNNNNNNKNITITYFEVRTGLPTFANLCSFPTIIHALDLTLQKNQIWYQKVSSWSMIICLIVKYIYLLCWLNSIQPVHDMYMYSSILFNLTTSKVIQLKRLNWFTNWLITTLHLPSVCSHFMSFIYTST